jgi:hypothetical protein
MAYKAILRRLHLVTDTVRQFHGPYHFNHSLLNFVWTTDTGLQAFAVACVGHLIL